MTSTKTMGDLQRRCSETFLIHFSTNLKERFPFTRDVTNHLTRINVGIDTTLETLSKHLSVLLSLRLSVSRSVSFSWKVPVSVSLYLRLFYTLSLYVGNYGPWTKSESAVCFNGKTREYFAEFSLKRKRIQQLIFRYRNSRRCDEYNHINLFVKLY